MHLISKLHSYFIFLVYLYDSVSIIKHAINNKSNYDFFIISPREELNLLGICFGIGYFLLLSIKKICIDWNAL